MWDDPPSRYYSSITVPTALIPAGNREWNTEHPARSAAASIAGAVVRAVAGADHDVHAQHADVVAEVILDLAAKAAR
jgi:pimeloyl-ACP methyl ester carboxylesterase